MMSAPPAPGHADPSAVRLTPAQLVLLVIVAGSLVRMVLAAAVGLGVDESYMAGISRQLSLSYLDHPPLHVWLVGVWGRLFGEHPLSLRLPFIILFAGSTWILFRLTAHVYGDRAGLWAAVAFNLAPSFTLSAASWVLPDGPMVFFALLAAWLAALAMSNDGGTASPAWLWLGAGAAGGLAMLSKYLGVFVFVGIGLFLLTSPRHRHWVLRREPWLGVAVAVLLMTPVLIWNASNGFASFAFQGQRGVPASFNINWLLQDLGGQLLYLLPWIAVPLAIAVGGAIRSSNDDDRFFGWLAAPAIVVFALLGFVARVLPHWPMIGWLFAFPLLGRALARHEPAHARLIRLTARCSAVFLAVILSLAASQAATGWASRAAPGLFAKDPTLDLFDWRALGPELAARGLLTPDMFVGTVHWIEAGKVNYAIGQTTPVMCLCSDARHFAFLHDTAAFAGRDAIVLSRSADQLRTASTRFAAFELLPDIVLLRGGSPAVILKLARGTSFKAAP